MARKDADRRLSAILSADVVGYSRLMGVDEVGTLDALNSSDVGKWHKPDLRFAAYEGPLTSGLSTLGAECLVSGGKPTVI